MAEAESGAGTSLKVCTCENEGQDYLHGKSIRVFNKTKEGNWRCTVCSSEKSGRTRE